MWREFFYFQVAQILLKSKLLSSKDDENDLQVTSQLTLNTSYKKYLFLLFYPCICSFILMESWF